MGRKTPALPYRQPAAAVVVAEKGVEEKRPRLLLKRRRLKERPLLLALSTIVPVVMTVRRHLKLCRKFKAEILRLIAVRMRKSKQNFLKNKSI